MGRGALPVRKTLSRAPAALLALLLVACGSSDYQGPVSDHFDGARFFNPGESFDKSLSDLIRFWWEREPGLWVRDLNPSTREPPPVRVDNGALRVTFINHATVLIQADGVNILTDPIWSERASPVRWAGPRRFVAPGIAFESLPKIDAVLISHDHYDHLDLPTLLRLREHSDPTYVVGLGQGALLRKHGLQRIVELDWWQSWPMPNGCALSAAPSKHWTGRFGAQKNRSLWLSFVIVTGGGPVYFAGDTGYGPHFIQTREKFGAMRYAILPIGAYLPRWLTDYQHMDPTQAVQAHLDLDSAASMGVHFGTFELSDEGQHQPPLDLAKARDRQGLPEAAFRAPEFGAGYHVPPLESSTPRGCRP
ncbi:MAG: MBL fold metallo-hydrolase [Panacagrimonas sp.]